MIRIGLTGGIGSGKTTVAKIFELLGVPVYFADDEAKRIMSRDEPLKKEIQKHFGEEAYINGELNRVFLASKVFNDEGKLELLNSIVHPATLSDAEEWFDRQTTAYAIKEAALIFEAGSEKNLDYVIGVHAPAALRIKRSMERDNASRDKVIERMNRQMDEEEKMKLCDFVLKNDEQELLIPQVLALHEKLVAIAKQKIITK
jgi:dephospho-CoA kinase